MAYSAPSTRSASDLMSHTIWNQDVKDNIIAIHDPPCAMVYHSTTQSLATATALSFNSEDYDTGTFHDTVTNNSRLTIPTTGVYLVTCFLKLSSPTAGRYQVELRLNAGGTPTAFHESNTASIYLTMTTIESLTAADYIEMFITHNGGGSQTVSADSRFGITWLGAGT